MSYLLTEEKEGILTITLNRPEALNALNLALIDELKQVFREKVYTDASLRGVILTGAGEKAFAAGADIAEFSGFNAEQGEAMSRSGHELMDLIEQSPQPVVAAVNGYALGGGCELAMACHLRVASERARFGQPEVNLGIIPGYGGTQRLVQLIGKGKALELMMTGDAIKADEALRLGLVNKVVAPEELLNACRDILLKIASKGPLAIQKVIACVNAYFREGTDGFGVEIKTFGSCFDTSDFREGTSAFLEKRAPRFSGK